MKTKSTAATAATQSVSNYMVLQLAKLYSVCSPGGVVRFLDMWEHVATKASSEKGLTDLLTFCQKLLQEPGSSRIADSYSRNHIKNLISLLEQKLKVAPNDKIDFNKYDTAIKMSGHIEAAVKRLMSSTTHSTLLRYSVLEALDNSENKLIEAINTFLPESEKFEIDYEVLKDYIKDFRIKQTYYGKSFEVVMCGVPVVKLTCKKI